jgi:NAD(P)-dependent dehydrogenase (short-subunit alcohol dehydrogenase family)
VTIAGDGATFKDKVVAITGTAGGVGQSLCRYFIDEGAKVAAVDKKATVESLLSDLEASPATFASAVADVSEPHEVERAFASLTGALGPVDILINNAGGSSHGTLARTPLGRIVEPIDIARAVGFLASDAASAITGVALPVDCGLMSGNIIMRKELTLEDL